MRNRQPFSKREWIQVIILLSLFQAFFWYVVFENSQSASALGYVSFAGTLVSIILAVLAIGYTYGESISSKNKNDALADQINTLGSLIESVEIEAKSLNKIHDISKELSGFVNSYRNDSQKSEVELRNLKKAFESFTQPKYQKSIHQEQSEFVGPLTQLDKLMANRSPLDEVCYLMLAYIELKQTEEGLYSMRDVLSDVLTETPMNLNAEFFYGAIYTQSSLLRNLKLIEFGHLQDLVLDDELRSYIVESMFSPSEQNTYSKDSYLALANKLHRLIKAC
ncbi:hypothetical protein D8T49_12270 [Vibrio vulnificus]|uniref:hypothetical protein n=1 Tax=Vibrio vulnificus TaxID=672 RepID=UPI001023961D|nr:hypothetical protein [Vibrio vulnificus]MBN8035024.1 hypothetical protein [Vibrio vulnificus]MCU8190518.1 hypothetical protein [Vibrio vulnificus]MCU8199291.1 hypothetical protein [Vibrio vulnificus]MCU8311550.1 hypothetical protein [Vibrio vulnificus]RZQ03397.1 hypothetical protein D8T37_12925 [Vibrio vulnificus]